MLRRRFFPVHPKLSSSCSSSSSTAVAATTVSLFRSCSSKNAEQQQQQQQQQQQEEESNKPDAVSSSCPFSGRPASESSSCPMEEVKPTSLYTIASQLGKSRLSGFVTATATAGYVLCGGTSPFVATTLTLGTYLQSLSANTANQIIEIKHDAVMKRTMFRPLVTGAISRKGALALCVGELAVGTAMLWTCTYPAVAALGLINWALYVCVYTPLKRVSAVNTWYGAIVGAIPPVMGGAAVSAAALASTTSAATSASATALTSSLLVAPVLYSPITAPAYLLGLIMFAWQIPHFMSLSFHCRRDYESAGYKMLAFSNPGRATSYAVGLSVLMAVMTVPCVHFVFPYPIEPWYYVVASAANFLMILKSVRFYQDPKRFCRACFVFSYMYLAAMLALLCFHHTQPVHRIQKLLDNHNRSKNQEEENSKQEEATV